LLHEPRPDTPHAVTDADIAKSGGIRKFAIVYGTKMQSFFKDLRKYLTDYLLNTSDIFERTG
jgi:hypothetical protein